MKLKLEKSAEIRCHSLFQTTQDFILTLWGKLFLLDILICCYEKDFLLKSKCKKVNFHVKKSMGLRCNGFYYTKSSFTKHWCDSYEFKSKILSFIDKNRNFFYWIKITQSFWYLNPLAKLLKITSLKFIRTLSTSYKGLFRSSF